VIEVAIAGAGPAGTSAAIAASLTGARVDIYERSRMPRHKVCGEFLSPEILDPIDRLGLSSAVYAKGPSRIERLRLRFPTVEKTAILPEPALGLSRYAFDQLLLDRALETGATLHRASAPLEHRPLIVACGRDGRHALDDAPRLFGFKSHFTGPAADAIELFFFKDAYVGVSCIEQGRTNICGIASELILRKFGFNFDEFVEGFRPLRERIQPLQRVMKWLTTGPLVFRNRLREVVPEGTYPAGDALSFVDPFTGTGLAAALINGRAAGVSSTSNVSTTEYLNLCRKVLHRSFVASSLYRSALQTNWAEWAAAALPAKLLVKLTRPRLQI
jgi:menaquinone-9 beta-reductase